MKIESMIIQASSSSLKSYVDVSGWLILTVTKATTNRSQNFDRQIRQLHFFSEGDLCGKKPRPRIDCPGSKRFRQLTINSLKIMPHKCGAKY